ncbi:jmjC domain-containing protein 4-like [Tropilaelaps mercedesae]|uniref:Jumonji domain-containing protein 4 n=1 Tax=Tropilaelaps mercedesae TaxID=418985 RepID=A0A1V9XCS9_9ACAR|nr:jmjC domain-containing protein 4-like [Tropilaelaps mercedesae]
MSYASYNITLEMFERDIKHFQAENLSEVDFCKLMMRNEACRISNVTDRWQANEWTVPATGEVNVRVLEDLFGECTVPVADCQRTEYDSQPKQEMSMKDYLDYWKSYRRPTIREDAWGSIERGNCLYLKDWHMQLGLPHYRAYEVPTYFASDWLNEYWLGKRGTADDYRFVYIGPQGSWTPLHCDVFGSYSWSANVCGKKLWLLLLPGEETFYRYDDGKLVYDLTEIDLQRCPRAEEHRSAGGPIVVMQNPGEVVFVPSGWHHQVLNVTDTISINHNWFNRFNLAFVVERLCAAEAEVMDTLDFMQGDDDFRNQVEIVLRAHHGMNRTDLQEILAFIAERRMASNEPASTPDRLLDLESCRKYSTDEVLNDQISGYLSNR